MKFSVYLPVNQTTGMGFGNEYGCETDSDSCCFDDWLVFFNPIRDKQKASKNMKAVRPKMRNTFLEFMVVKFMMV